MHDWTGAKDVISKERLSELSTTRSDGPAALYLLSHVGAIAATTTALYWTQDTWWCLPFFALQGTLINFLYAPEHECDHFTAFRTRWLNVWVARLCGFFIFLSNDDHRWSHYAHHKHTQNWDIDPELMAREKMMTPWHYFWLLSGLPSIWGRTKSLCRHALGLSAGWWVTEKQQRDIERWARIHLAGYVAIAASAMMMESFWPVYYWLGPFVAMRWTYWLQGLAEHGCLTHEPQTLLNTRTLRTNAFMRWVNWNMTYHTVHHTYPSVPFHRLPALHLEVEEKLGFELPGGPYFKTHWKHLRAMFAGATELDLSAEHDRKIRESGELGRLVEER